MGTQPGWLGVGLTWYIYIRLRYLNRYPVSDIFSNWGTNAEKSADAFGVEIHLADI